MCVEADRLDAWTFFFAVVNSVQNENLFLPQAIEGNDFITKK